MTGGPVVWKQEFGAMVLARIVLVTSRIERARLLIANTSENLSSIALGVGYDNYRKRTQRSPSEYRKRMSDRIES